MPTSFEDLEAFQRAIDLMVEVYRASSTFPRQELYGFTSQIRRSSSSIVANVAEGQGRLTTGEWLQFLGSARGSLYETEAHLIGARRLGFVDVPTYTDLRKRTAHVARLLAGLIREGKKRKLLQSKAIARRHRVTATVKPRSG